MNLSKRLLALEAIKAVKQADNEPWVINIEIVEMNEKREIVTVGRHRHFKNEVINGDC